MMRQVAYIAIQRFPFVLWVVFLIFVNFDVWVFCDWGKGEGEGNVGLYLLYHHAIGFSSW